MHCTRHCRVANVGLAMNIVMSASEDNESTSHFMKAHGCACMREQQLIELITVIQAMHPVVFGRSLERPQYFRPRRCWRRVRNIIMTSAYIPFNKPYDVHEATRTHFNDNST